MYPCTLKTNLAIILFRPQHTSQHGICLEDGKLIFSPIWQLCYSGWGEFKDKISRLGNYVMKQPGSIMLGVLNDTVVIVTAHLQGWTLMRWELWTLQLSLARDLKVQAQSQQFKSNRMSRNIRYFQTYLRCMESSQQEGETPHIFRNPYQHSERWHRETNLEGTSRDPPGSRPSSSHTRGRPSWSCSKRSLQGRQQQFFAFSATLPIWAEEQHQWRLWREHRGAPSPIHVDLGTIPNPPQPWNFCRDCT